MRRKKKPGAGPGFFLSVQMNEIIANTADDDDRWDGPHNKYWHLRLLQFAHVTKRTRMQDGS